MRAFRSKTVCRKTAVTLTGFACLVALSATSSASDVRVRVRDDAGNLRPDVTVGYSVDGAEAEKATVEGTGTFLLGNLNGTKLTLQVDGVGGSASDHGVAEVSLPNDFDYVGVRMDNGTIRAGAIGEWGLTDLLGESSGNGAPGPNGCASGTYCQISDFLGQGAGGSLANNATTGPGFEVIDNFEVVTSGSATDFCWFGVYLDFGAGFADCAGSTGDAVTVTYYADAAGVPGAVIGGPFAVGVTRTNTGRDLVAGGGAIVLDEYRLEGSHPAVPVTAGDVVWMGITNGTAGTCSFAVLTAPPGDGNAFQVGGPGTLDHDQSFCTNVDAAAPGGGPPMGPANDNCENAIAIAPAPSITNGTTLGSNFDGAPFCGTSNTAGGVWYTVTGTGNTMTLSTCFADGNGSADYDTKITVYCGDCADIGGLECVAGNDDSPNCGNPDFLSTVSWCSQAGAEYLVLVHGFGTDTGNFSMELTDDGASCGGAVFCLTAGACCIDLGGGLFDCVETTAADCASMGGDYQGDNTSCPDLSYTVSSCNGGWEDITMPDPMGNMGMALGLGDDNGVVLPLGFTFNFFGTAHTTVGVASNGYLTFGTDLGDFTNDPIPSTIDPNDMIAPLWNDWSPNIAGEVYAGSFGMAPNRAFVASWVDVPTFGDTDSNTFQAILFENSNKISFRYLGFTPEAFAGDYTVGVENQDGTAGTSIAASTIMSGDCINLFPDVLTSCGSPIAVDVEPDDCPNLFNDLNHGLVQIALPGTGAYPANEIVTESVRMRRADGVGASVALYLRDINGSQGTIGDVTSPYNGPVGACDIGTPDGVDDLSFEVRTRDINDALRLDQLPAGSQVVVEFSGLMSDGRVFNAQDTITVDLEQHPSPVTVTFRSALEDVAIDVTEDLNGDNLGFTPHFQRLYTPGTVVTMDAPSGQGTNVQHVGFLVDGVRVPGNPGQFTVGSNDMTVRVLYKVRQGRGSSKGLSSGF